MDHITKQKKYSFKLNEFLLAIIICSNSLNWIFKIENGFVILIFASFLMLLFFNFRNIITSLNAKTVFFIIYIYVFFLIPEFSNNVNSKLPLYLLQFSILGVIPLIISSLKFKTESVLRYIFLIGLLFLPFIFSFSINSYLSLKEIDGGGGIMGLSYGFLVYCVSILIIILLYKNQKKFLKILMYVELSAILFFLLSYGSRGPLVALIILFIVLKVIKKTDSFNLRFYVNLLSVLIVSVFVIWLFIYVIYPLLQSNDIYFSFIDKFYRLSEEGDISNGRNVIYNYTINSIFDKPIFGHSIGSFGYMGVSYPHNLILHFLYEGGFMLGLPIIYLIGKSFYIIFSVKYEWNYRILIVYLFFASTIGLMFSSYPWMSHIFWLLIGTVLNSSKYKVFSDIKIQSLYKEN